MIPIFLLAAAWVGAGRSLFSQRNKGHKNFILEANATDSERMTVEQEAKVPARKVSLFYAFLLFIYLPVPSASPLHVCSTGSYPPLQTSFLIFCFGSLVIFFPHLSGEGC